MDEEQKNFKIPSSNIESLQKVINKWKNKGANITFDIINKEVDDKGRVWYNVVVEGGYKLEDWDFAATIDHTDNGNIVLAMPEFYGKIPEKFYNTKSYCEHCKQERNRKKTYVVYNTKTNEFKQVGSDCLESYTGFDAKEAADYASAIKEIHSIVEYDDPDDPYSPSYYNRGNSNYISPEQLKAGLYEVVSKYGYDKNDRNGFYGKLNNVLGFNLIDPREKSNKREEVYNKNKDKVNEINAWVNTLANSKNDYLRNAYAAWNKPTIELNYIYLLGSLVSFYLKSKEKENQAEQTSYAGNVGDKVTFTVQNARVIYNIPSKYYNSPDTLIYIIVDTNGNTYKWSTTQTVKEGDVVTATIIAHNVYNGTNQTVISKGKISESEEKIKQREEERNRKIEEKREFCNDLTDRLLDFYKKYYPDIKIEYTKEEISEGLFNDRFSTDSIQMLVEDVYDKINVKGEDYSIIQKLFEDLIDYREGKYKMKDSCKKDAVPEDKRKELRDLYNRLYDMLFEGSNGDVPENIEKAYKEVGGECGFKEKTPKYLNVVGKVGSYKLNNLISIERLYGDLNRLAEDLTMAYARNNGIDPETTTSAFIKSLDDAVAGATPYAQRIKRQEEREAIETRLSEIEHLIDMREDFLESDKAENQPDQFLKRIQYDIMRLTKEKERLTKLYNQSFEEEYGYWKDAKKDNLNETLKAFYVREYPDDDLGEFLDDKNTFEDLRVALITGRDVYDLMGEADDSVIRERLFSELAKRLGVKYSLIYNMWVGTPKSIRYSTRDSVKDEESFTYEYIVNVKENYDAHGVYYTGYPDEDGYPDTDWYDVYTNDNDIREFEYEFGEEIKKAIEKEFPDAFNVNVSYEDEYYFVSITTNTKKSDEELKNLFDKIKKMGIDDDDVRIDEDNDGYISYQVDILVTDIEPYTED